MEAWALDRIEEVTAPYHDWQPDDVAVLGVDIELRVGANGVDILRSGSGAGRMNGSAWSVEFARHLQKSSRMPVGELANELGVPFERLAQALLMLERVGVIRTELAERCAHGAVDE
ncbi:hypothetical protein [Nonomuraea sp. NPDC050643]|uniref:hypothetical protein n=1 Tax=Nonomuraea sp. NPDC050643 TaxID=3155660 RepID=UPI0033DA19DB